MKKIPPATKISIPVALMGLAVASALLAAAWSGASRWLILVGAVFAAISAGLAWWTHHAALAMQQHAVDQADAAAEAELHYFQVLRNVVRMVESRHVSSAGRSERMGKLTRQVASQLGMSHRQAELLGLAAEVHDVGMLAVPEHVLSKAGLLQRADRQAIKDHPQVGHHILQPLTFLHEVLDAVLYHHERLNGTGYPHGRAGEQIPLSARILAVVESYEAMTHDRPNRAALSGGQAIRELARCAGDGFDPQCVRALAEAVHLVHHLPEQGQPETPAEPAQAVCPA